MDSAGSTVAPSRKNRAGTPSTAPTRMATYSLGFRTRSARASSRARLAPQSRFSTTLLKSVTDLELDSSVRSETRFSLAASDASDFSW